MYRPHHVRELQINYATYILIRNTASCSDSLHSMKLNVCDSDPISVLENFLWTLSNVWMSVCVCVCMYVFIDTDLYLTYYTLVS